MGSSGRQTTSSWHPGGMITRYSAQCCSRGAQHLYILTKICHTPPSFKLQCGAFNSWAVSNCTSQ